MTPVADLIQSSPLATNIGASDIRDDAVTFARQFRRIEYLTLRRSLQRGSHSKPAASHEYLSPQTFVMTR